MRSPDSFRYRWAHVDDLDLLTAVDLVAKGNRVRDDNLAQHAVVKDIDRIPYIEKREWLVSKQLL